VGWLLQRGNGSRQRGEALSSVIPTACGTSFRGFSIIQLHDELKAESAVLRTDIVSRCVSKGTRDGPQGASCTPRNAPSPIVLIRLVPAHQLEGFLGQPLSGRVTFCRYIYYYRSRDSAVDIVTGCGLATERLELESRILSPPSLPDRLWGPPNLLSNGYRG
jgi:hypothetical protein